MGEVFRAHDTKLGRDVALKVLSPAFALDPDRLARFRREAQLLASLNHHNIAAIYGLEESDSVQALVLELVEGPTLADRIVEGPIPLHDVLAISRQIADALEAAHEKGIVHRDLKPANVKLRPDGTVKVLDFGLAKAAEGEEGALNLSHSPTKSFGGTRAGAILGTALYMSPEQARGVVIDKRTDIWSFGCVLFELLTGRRLYQGDTLSDIIVSVLTHEVDWRALPEDTPPSVRRLLHRCLQRDPKRRLRDIGDARADIDEPIEIPDAIRPSASARAPQREVEFQRLTDFTGTKESPAMSPDGKMVAFVALVAGRRQIWVRLLAGSALLQVTRDDVEHEQPRWASDSSTIIYHTPSARRGEPGTIWEISALGGWPRRIASAVGGGDISHDGRRIALFQPSGEQPALTIVARDGSRAEHVALLSLGYSYTSPRWAPDDSAIAVLRAADGGFDVCLEVISVPSGERREIVRSRWLKGFCWLPDGSGFVYSSSHGSTMLYPPVFNLRTVGRGGDTDRQLTFGDQSYVDPDAHHQTGKLLASRIRSQSDIWRFPTSGSPAQNTGDAIRITRQTGQVQVPTVSPDGRDVAYVSDSGGHANLWVAATDGSTARQITFERDGGVSVGVSKWSARNVIAFLLTQSGPIGQAGQTGLWTIEPDGSGLRQVVAGGWSPCWSGDGCWLYYQPFADGMQRLEKLSIDDGRSVVVRNESDASCPAVSADGSTLDHSAALRSSIFGRRGADIEVRRARPEDGPAEVIARIPRERVPFSPLLIGWALSPDGEWLAIPLLDGGTANLWAIPTMGGTMKPITDFGDRSILITRSISWSPDGGYLYAAVAEKKSMSC